MFRQKLLLSFIGMAVLACGVVGYASYRVSLSTQTESVQRYYSRLLEQIATETAIRLENIENTCRYMAADENLQRTIGRSTLDYDKITFIEFITRYGFPIVNLLPVDSQVRLYVTNPELPERYYESFPRPLPKPADAFPRRFEILQSSRIKGLPWQEETASVYGYGSLWRQTEDDVSAGRISLFMNLYDFRSYLAVEPEKSRLAIIRATVRLADILSVTPFIDGSDSVRFALLDSKNEPLYLAKGLDNTQYDAIKDQPEKNGYYPFKQALRSGFSVEAYVPKAAIQTEARKIWLMSTIITLSCMSFFALIGILFSRYFGGYVQQLIHFIQHLRDGDFKSRLVPKTRDELYLVSLALNDMAETLDTLVNEVYVANMERTDAELQLLLAQINPHLLYNSLASIGNLIRLKLPDKACEVVSSLTAFYRISLSQGRDLIPVREEILHVESYVAVKAMQLNDLIHLEMDISDDTLELMTPKVILQPLVENIFKHALYMNRPIHVGIKAACQENKLIFSIKDDGIGMDSALVSHLNEGNLDELGIGIRNTLQRIHLKAGEKYGLHFDSTPGVGTTVTIQLPILLA